MLSKKIIILACAVPIAYYWFKYIKTGPVYQSEKRLDGKTVLVTGGNSGIGKSVAILFAKRGAKVIIASRNLKKSDKARDDIIQETNNKNVVAMKLDLEDFSSIQLFVNEFDEQQKNLHYLINNAGVIRLRGMTDYGCNRVIAINHFGPFLLTNLILDKMKKQSETSPVRIINVSSESHRFSAFEFEMMHQDSDSIFTDLKMYGQSKLANIYFTTELNKRLKGFDITTYSVHPGTIKSDIGENNGQEMGIILRVYQFFALTFVARQPFYGAQTIMYCALDDNVTQLSGKYFVEVAHRELQSFAKIEEVGSRLWKESVDVTRKYLTSEL